MPQTPNTNTQPKAKTVKEWAEDLLGIATGEKSPTIGATIDNVPEIRNALLTVVGVALIGWLVVKLIIFGIARASEKEA